MSHHYPYESTLAAAIKNWKKGQDYLIWQNAEPLTKRIEHIHGPIIEIGGPTDTGFYFLDGIDLPSKPLITNISDNPSPYAEHASEIARQVEAIVDATQLPYADGSVGAFLMAAMSVSSDWWVGLSDTEKDAAATKIDEAFNNAKMEMGQVAAGVMEPEAATHALRIRIYREIHRALTKGGLLFCDGSLEDIVILKRLGFTLVAFLQYQDQGIDGWQNLSYEFVVSK